MVMQVHFMFESLSQLVLEKNAEIARLNVENHNLQVELHALQIKSSEEIAKSFEAGFEFGIASDLEEHEAWLEYQSTNSPDKDI